MEVGIATAQGHATESGPKHFVSVIRDSSRLPHTSYFDEVHSPHNSIWDLPEAIEGVPFVPYERHVAPSSLPAIEETLHGTIWSLISPLLTTDDVVKCRTVAWRWNMGCRFFEFPENDPFVRQWYRDVEGNKVCTKSKKNNPFVESFRQWGLHAPEAAAVPCEVTSLGEAGTNLMNDVRIREIFINKGYCECDSVDSMSRGSLSSDLGDTWYHGPPMSERWAGGLDDHSANTVEEECEDWSSDELGRGVGRAARDFISEVRESSLWAPLCDTPADVLVLRTAGSKWYDAKLYGGFAELWFFLMKTKGMDASPPVPPLELTNLWHFGFGLFEPGRLPNLTAFASST